MLKAETQEPRDSLQVRELPFSKMPAQKEAPSCCATIYHGV